MFGEQVSVAQGMRRLPVLGALERTVAPMSQNGRRGEKRQDLRGIYDLFWQFGRSVSTVIAQPS